MAAQKAQLKDPTTGEKIYPVTSSACVGMSDGSGNLDNKLTGLDNKTIQDIEKAKFDATAATEDRVLFSYEKSEAATIKFKDNFYFNVLYENAIWITNYHFCA